MEKMNNFQIPFPARFALFAAAAVLMCAASMFAQGEQVIHVRPHTTVEKETVTLGDIADIPAGRKLGAISLGYAPNIGATRELTRAQIILAITAAGISENEFVLDSPLKVLIRRAGQAVSGDRVRGSVEKAVLANFPAGNVEARIVRLDVPENLQIPAGKLDIRVNAANVRNFFSKFSLPVEVRVDDRIIRTFAANVEVEAFAKVLVAARDLPVNGRITEADVRFEKKKLEKPVTSYLLETTPLRGAMLIRSVPAGSEITTDLFIAGVVVKAGDTIRLEAVSGNLKLIITGEARTSGKIGDRISVKNLQSGAILQATVVDEGYARAAF
jgi:flagellar basal body P-ring formation protein FlgA